jgi:hypothetical protein
MWSTAPGPNLFLPSSLHLLLYIVVAISTCGTFLDRDCIMCHTERKTISPCTTSPTDFVVRHGNRRRKAPMWICGIVFEESLAIPSLFSRSQPASSQESVTTGLLGHPPGVVIVAG